MTKASSYYYQHASALNRELKQEIPTEVLKQLHRKNPAHHLFIAGRQLALLIGLPLVIYFVPSLWVQVPAMILQGVVVFSFSVLLHEAIHKAVFNKDRANLTQKLGYLYAMLSGLSYSQFKRWHLDHHDELGSSELDPKRAELSPKRNARWYKFLYFTVGLYPIYFAAAARAQKAYPQKLRQAIKRERMVAIGFHLAVMAGFALISPMFALKAWAIPIFVVFPVAFAVNRLGQHYVIDPDRVANWSTLMRPNPIWNFLFLFSSYHLEHHYFPAVPFYKLKALQKELNGFYARHNLVAYSYTHLLKCWFWDNHQPHTRPQHQPRTESVIIEQVPGA